MRTIKSNVLAVIVFALSIIGVAHAVENTDKAPPECGFAHGTVIRSWFDLDPPGNECFSGVVYSHDGKSSPDKVTWVCWNGEVKKDCTAKKAAVFWSIDGRINPIGSYMSGPFLVVSDTKQGLKKEFDINDGHGGSYNIVDPRGNFETGTVLLQHANVYRGGTVRYAILTYRGSEMKLTELELEKTYYYGARPCGEPDFGDLNVRLVGQSHVLEVMSRTDFGDEAPYYCPASCCRTATKRTDHIIWKIGPNGLKKVRTITVDK